MIINTQDLETMRDAGVSPSLVEWCDSHRNTTWKQALRKAGTHPTDARKIRRLWLLAFRHERGMTQVDMAEAIGVTTRTISRWENGDTPVARVVPYILDGLEGEDDR